MPNSNEGMRGRGKSQKKYKKNIFYEEIERQATSVEHLCFHTHCLTNTYKNTQKKYGENKLWLIFSLSHRVQNEYSPSARLE